MQDQNTNASYSFILQQRCHLPKRPKPRHLGADGYNMYVPRRTQKVGTQLQKSTELPKNIREDKYKDSDTMFMNTTQYKKSKVFLNGGTELMQFKQTPKRFYCYNCHH